MFSRITNDARDAGRQASALLRIHIMSRDAIARAAYDMTTAVQQMDTSMRILNEAGFMVEYQRVHSQMNTFTRVIRALGRMEQNHTRYALNWYSVLQRSEYFLRNTHQDF
jgi:hypothetical protein